VGTRASNLSTSSSNRSRRIVAVRLGTGMRPLGRNATLCQGEFPVRSSRNSGSTSRGESAAPPSTPCGLAAAPRRVVADGVSEAVKQSLAGKRQDLSFRARSANMSAGRGCASREEAARWPSTSCTSRSSRGARGAASRERRRTGRASVGHGRLPCRGLQRSASPLGKRSCSAKPNQLG
jgi:hypothetical protein